MKNIKNHLIAIIVLVLGNVLPIITAEAQPVENFVRKPLAEWPKVHPFSSQEEMDYYKKSTWNSKLTLENNRKALVKNFVDVCCDFSFRMLPQKLREIYVGTLSSSEKLVFLGTSATIYSDEDYQKIAIFNDKYTKDGGVLFDRDVDSFFNYQPIADGNAFRDQFVRCFLKLAEDSVGCKLFRIYLTKSIVNKLSKIVFIPVKEVKKDSLGVIGCVEGCDICYYLAELGNAGAVNHLKREKRHRFVLFSPAFFSESISISVVRYLCGDLLIEPSQLLQESALFHEMIHSLHTQVDHKLIDSTVIKNRSCPSIFKYIEEKTNTPLYLHCNHINLNLFHNDEEYHTMYGLTKDGLDLLNESSYLAHRYGFLRMSHEDTQTSTISVDEVKLDNEQSRDFVQKFFIDCGDHDLFRYYLSPNSSISFPEFGIGQYVCADLDPQTGEKIESPDNQSNKNEK